MASPKEFVDISPCQEIGYRVDAMPVASFGPKGVVLAGDWLDLTRTQVSN